MLSKVSSSSSILNIAIFPEKIREGFCRIKESIIMINQTPRGTIL